jgi:hypothetical protein
VVRFRIGNTRLTAAITPSEKEIDCMLATGMEAS